MSALSAAASDEDGETIRNLKAQMGRANALCRIRLDRIRELESMLYAVGAGGVGNVEQPPVVGQEPVAWAVMKNGEICWDADYPFSNEPGWRDSDQECAPLYTHPQPRQPLAAELQDAFFEGFCAVETYNDTRLNSVDEEWEKYKTAHGIGGKA